jgi:hypothetical protein
MPGRYYQRAMSSKGPVLPIHSLTEARLYIKARSCSSCGVGPLALDEAGSCYDAGQELLTVPVTCSHCGQRESVCFDTEEVDRRGPVLGMLFELRDACRQPAAQVINPTREPSRIIDVAGWLMLHTMLAGAARTAAAESMSLSKRAAVRRMQVEAGQCVDEALKFYDEDNDLPPREAFFSEQGFRQFLDRPELFTRQRLIELRGQFPR